MALLLEILPYLIAMALFMAGSAFFSASEAALFSLRWADRKAMAEAGGGQGVAMALLGDPDRLLSAVLFWNLLINMAYFALASLVSFRLEENPTAGPTLAWLFGLAALISIIVFSEMLPKSVAVLSPRLLSGLVSWPLALAVRIVDPLMPLLRFVNVMSHRLIWPGFEHEQYLDLADLERAITLSTTDASLLEQEQAALQNIVQLSDLRVDELMRPRTQFVSFSPPISKSDLRERTPPSRHMLVREADSDDVVAAAPLSELIDMPDEHIEHYAEPVAYVPWCATAATALELMQNQDRDVAAVVNEFGETIGVITFSDVLDTVFARSPSRSGRLLQQTPIQPVGGDRYHVTGLTSLRRLSKYFGLELPETANITVAGVVQEMVGGGIEAGAEFQWGPFEFHILETPERGQMIVELSLVRSEAP